MELYLITKRALEKEGYSPGEAHEKALDASGMRDYFDKMSENKDGGIIGAGGITPEEMKKIKKSAEYKGCFINPGCSI